MNTDKDSIKASAELLEVVIDTFVTPDGLAKDQRWIRKFEQLL
ncbi:hypothetical protein [Acinetobacter haemolyticus]|nr:hypothetical protein [Acinetobacter haemolyticus]